MIELFRFLFFLFFFCELLDLPLKATPLIPSTIDKSKPRETNLNCCAVDVLPIGRRDSFRDGCQIYGVAND